MRSGGDSGFAHADDGLTMGDADVENEGDDDMDVPLFKCKDLKTNREDIMTDQ